MAPGEIVTTFIEAIEAQDLERALGLLDPEVEYDNVPIGKVHGTDAVRNVLAPFLAGCSAVEWVVHRQVEDDGGDGSGTVMNERTDRFRMGDGDEARWVEIPLAGLFVVEDDRIVLWRDYFDDATFRAQLTGS
jgi:limonene-1,2-epoxide hydrolase